MKKTIQITLIAIWITSGVMSCSSKPGQPEPTEPKHRNFGLLIYSPNVQDGTVECDSFKMTSKQEAIIWVDGFSSTIKAEEIIPASKKE
jgi:hypothetical protein